MDPSLPLFKIDKAPPVLFYVPNFITEYEESEILTKVNEAPKPKWTYLRNRRLQNWGGLPTAKGMIQEAMPQWLKTYVNKVSDAEVYDNGNVRANHVLVNEYLPGQGIMPHEDGPIFYPTVATISCGSHTILRFTEKPNDESTPRKFGVFLGRRSLVVVTQDLYSNYLHSIEERHEDTIDESILNWSSSGLKIGESAHRSTRISLTIRNVPKISKLKLSFLAT